MGPRQKSPPPRCFCASKSRQSPVFSTFREHRSSTEKRDIYFFYLTRAASKKRTKNAYSSAHHRGQGCLHHLRRELRRRQRGRLLLGRHPPRSRLQRHQRALRL